MTKIGKPQLPLVLIDQAEADQIGHVSLREELRLRNAKGDAAQGAFLVRTEWCLKTTFHGLPPSSCEPEI
jgi:hypothetical protein